MPDFDEAAAEAARLAILDRVLNPPGEEMGADGRFYSPWIERGSDGIPKSVSMPSMQEMRNMNAGQLSGVMERYGYVDSIDARIDMNKEFLRRFNIGPKDPRYALEMDRLAGKQNIAMLGETRRLAQRHEGLRAIGGNLDQGVVYINESSEPCEECEPLGGTEGTYREFVENGMLPGDRCLGQGNCLCTVMAVRVA
jgi:hypothetical protein